MHVSLKTLKDLHCNSISTHKTGVECGCGRAGAGEAGLERSKIEYWFWSSMLDRLELSFSIFCHIFRFRGMSSSIFPSKMSKFIRENEKFTFMYLNFIAIMFDLNFPEI